SRRQLTFVLLSLVVVAALAGISYLYINAGMPYADPAGRFSLRIPFGWTIGGYELNETLFTDARGRVVRASAFPAQSDDIYQAVVAAQDRFGPEASGFTFLVPPQPAVMGRAPAVYTEYRYTTPDGTVALEAAYFTLQAGQLHGLHM